MMTSKTTSIIDLDAKPDAFAVAPSWKVEEHQQGGQFFWQPKKVQLFVHDKQNEGHGLRGDRLRKQLADKSVFNVNLMDYLLAHQRLIPKAWRVDGRSIFFWGTIYYDSFLKKFCVRCMTYDASDGLWTDGAQYLDRRWEATDFSAITI